MKTRVVTGPTSLRSLVTTVGEKAAARKEAASRKRTWSMGWKPPKKADEISAHHPAGASGTVAETEASESTGFPTLQVEDVAPLGASDAFKERLQRTSPTLRLSEPTSVGPIADPFPPRASTSASSPPERPRRAWPNAAGWLVAASLGLSWLAISILGDDRTPTLREAEPSPLVLARPATPLPGAVTETAFIALQQQHARLEHRLEAWQAAAEVDVVPAEEFALERRRHLVAYDRLAELDAFVVDQDRVIETLRDQVSHLRRVLAARSVTLDAIAARD